MIRFTVLIIGVCAALIALADTLGSQVKASTAHRAAQIEAAGG